MLALFQALAVAAAGHCAAPLVYAKPKTAGVLAEFVSLVTDSDMFKSQLAHMGVDTAKMPLGNGCLIASDDETLLDDLPPLGNGT